LMNWLSKISGLKKVFLTHGEELQRLVLKEKIKQEMEDMEVFMPNLEDEIEL